eukprot:tig00000615_g2529.t1
MASGNNNDRDQVKDICNRAGANSFRMGTGNCLFARVKPVEPSAPSYWSKSAFDWFKFKQDDDAQVVEAEADMDAAELEAEMEAEAAMLDAQGAAVEAEISV